MMIVMTSVRNTSHINRMQKALTQENSVFCRKTTPFKYQAHYS